MSFSSAPQQPKTEHDYFLLRCEKPGTIFVSKQMPNFGQEYDARYIRKVLKKEEHTKFEKIGGATVLRTSPGGFDQMVAVVHSCNSEQKIDRVTIQRFRLSKDGLSPVNNHDYSFGRTEFNELLAFLQEVKLIDYSNPDNFQIRQSNVIKDQPQSSSANTASPPELVINSAERELLALYRNLDGSARTSFLTGLRSQNLTHDDINTILGRKEGLRDFENHLSNSNDDWNEKNWQSFFENNSWIFGYGLEYKFLDIIQREASVSNTNVDGKEAVYSDFLLGDNKFTMLVELKRPDTILFENDSVRSKTWKLSRDLIYAVSQILTQKAEWEIKADKENNYRADGALITERTFDPKTILIIGSSLEFAGNSRDQEIKAKTFELYRRNLRNIDILTYDELFERAKFIVNHDPAKKTIYSISDSTFDAEDEYDFDEENDLPF